jgi:octopine/nopaline transport system permease protein
MGLLAFGDTGWGDELFFATLMTIAVAAAAIFIGFFLAAIFASFKLSKIRILNLIGSFYTTVFRGVPELLVIYLLFFGGSGAVMYVAKIFGYDGYIEVNAFITGAFSIGIISDNSGNPIGHKQANNLFKNTDYKMTKKERFAYLSKNRQYLKR